MLSASQSNKGADKALEIAALAKSALEAPNAPIAILSYSVFAALWSLTVAISALSTSVTEYLKDFFSFEIPRAVTSNTQ